MPKPTSAVMIGRLHASLVRFRDDERGSMTLIILFTFLAMIMFGGIAVDVMRFETRRVAMQQTVDRAALAASGLPDTDDLTKVHTPIALANDWFAKASLGTGLNMVEFSTPTVSAINIPGKREVTIAADVRSYNFFMGIFSPHDYLEGPTSTKAAQGVSNVEVMLVLDITGSMGEPIESGKSKLKALQEAANSFIDIVSDNDKKNGVSIGIVPYAAQVNIPVSLRQQFTVTDLATWDGGDDAGVPGINCLEFPESGYTTPGVSLTTPVPMAAYADSRTATNRDNGIFYAPEAPIANTRACTTNAETDTTDWVDAEVNQIMLPTKDKQKVRDKIDRLTAAGNTYIAVGMRWGTALMDQAARPIYDNLLSGEIDPKTGKKAMEGRPANNGDGRTRKIIILMTDGEHVVNNHVRDAYKSGTSPIWRGADGNFAIRFSNPTGLGAIPIRPGSGLAVAPSAIRTCSNWTLTNYANREFFVPHLKRNSVQRRVGATEPEGVGTGADTANGCDPQSWLAAPEWPGSGAVVRLDWSEVWQYVRVTWVAQQLYGRSGVTNAGYSTMLAAMRQTYLSSTANMDTLLKDNCAASRDTGVEIFGIMFDNAPSERGIAAMKNCVSSSEDTYYYEPKTTADLKTAFERIATDISDLRLTQ